MPAVAFDDKIHVHTAFFTDSDDGTRSVDTRKHVINHCAALIQHDCGLYALFAEIIYDIGTSLSIDFFFPGK